VTSRDLLSKYLFITELRFDTMLYSNLGNKNSDTGHINCSRGPQLAREPQAPTLALPYLRRKWCCFVFG